MRSAGGPMRQAQWKCPIAGPAKWVPRLSMGRVHHDGAANRMPQCAASLCHGALSLLVPAAARWWAQRRALRRLRHPPRA
jgi:hypothetical protein